MSHLDTIECEFNSLPALKAGAKRLAMELVEDVETYRWWGRHMGDYPIPAGFTKADLGKCHHVIRMTGDIPSNGLGAPYEVGVVELAKLPVDHPARLVYAGQKFVLLWDFIDARLSKVMGGSKAPLFVQAYGIERAKIEAKRKGHRVVEHPPTKAGVIRVEIVTGG